MSYRTIIVLAAGAALSSAALLSLGSASMDTPPERGHARSDVPEQDRTSGVRIITRAEALRMGLEIPPPPPDPPSFADQFDGVNPGAIDAVEKGLSDPFADPTLPAVQAREADAAEGGPSAREQGGEYFHTIAPAPDFPGEAPPVESECDADFDQSGQVNVGDMLGYVHAWFGEAELEPELLDYNDSGAAEIDDLVMFLNIWFTGC